MGGIERPADYYRFCPGEEDIKISNAICRGRRKVHFPKCQACGFNDDLRAAGVAVGILPEKAREVSLIESMFRRFDVLGQTPEPLSNDAAWRIGHATAQYLYGRLRGFDRANPRVRCVVVGRDARASGEALASAAIEGIHSTGLDVLDIGVIDTPQLYFAVNDLGSCGGLQITGGKCGPSQNGFVICATGAFAISTETGLLSIRDIAARVPRHESGTTAKRAPVDLAERYGEFVRRRLAGGGPARRIKAVVDAAGGSAARWLPIVLEGVRNVQIVPLRFEEPAVCAVDLSPSGNTRLPELRRAVKEQAADFGVVFDADASCCGFVDERGGLVAADFVAALVGRRLLEREPGATVVLDHRMSRGAVDELERLGAAVARQRAAHPLIKKTMQERQALFGADLDGRFYFRDNFHCESAFFALMEVVNLLGETGRKLSELVRPLNRYRSSGELTFHCGDAERALAQLAAAYSDGDVEEWDGLTIRCDDWWFNARPGENASQLQVILEAPTKKLVDQRLKELTPVLGERI